MPARVASVHGLQGAGDVAKHSGKAVSHNGAEITPGMWPIAGRTPTWPHEQDPATEGSGDTKPWKVPNIPGHAAKLAPSRKHNFMFGVDAHGLGATRRPDRHPGSADRDPAADSRSSREHHQPRNK